MRFPVTAATTGAQLLVGPVAVVHNVNPYFKRQNCPRGPTTWFCHMDSCYQDTSFAYFLCRILGRSREERVAHLEEVW